MLMPHNEDCKPKEKAIVTRGEGEREGAGGSAYTTKKTNGKDAINTIKTQAATLDDS